MRTVKVKVLARSDKDADYICRLLAQGKGIFLCDAVLEADAVVFEGDLLTKAEKKALEALVEFGSCKKAAEKISKTPSTLKKQIHSAKKKLDAKTNIQAVLIAYRLGLLKSRLDEKERS
ncbi:MAG: helix-turn-helix transcriptional regulator [Armatimonadota bacterium]|nr:helix-turn-helix transcriptional regulator [Armatimonadota bacterium]